MKVQHILIDDNNPEHGELSICRSGRINRVRFQDKAYKIYRSLEIEAHDYAAFFHYGFPEAFNLLPFVSESGNGLDSWDEAFLPSGSLLLMNRIIEERLASIEEKNHEMILLGWQDEPVGVAYLRDIDPKRFVGFLRELQKFVAESEAEGFDLEFIL